MENKTLIENSDQGSPLETLQVPGPTDEDKNNQILRDSTPIKGSINNGRYRVNSDGSKTYFYPYLRQDGSQAYHLKTNVRNKQPQQGPKNKRGRKKLTKTLINEKIKTMSEDNQKRVLDFINIIILGEHEE